MSADPLHGKPFRREPVPGCPQPERDIAHAREAEQTQANARLIAAAPELLCLAREIAENLILSGMGIGQRAREIIAKATGEQP